jgi:hypothetical protein
VSPRISKLFLTVHIVFSAGWLGAVAVFLVLAIAGLNGSDIHLARSVYLAMELSAWYVIVPFCLASFCTGIVQAAGSKWGLFRHYWIAVKLFLTVALTILLLLHMKPISYMAGLATDGSFAKIRESGFRIQLVANAGAAILVLLAITTISVYKPWGKIKKIRKLNSENKSAKKSWRFYLMIGMIVLVLIITVMHLLGGGMGRH